MELSADEIAARTELGGAMRRLQHAVVGRHNDPDDLAAVAWQLDDLSDRLEKREVRVRPGLDVERQDVTEVDDGEIMGTFIDRPFSGHGSPFGLDFVVRRDGPAGVATTLTLGPAHEGPPARSHGGIIAGFFDDLTGYVLHIDQITAFTGELTIRFEAPAPIGVPLLAKAWLDGRDGRKLYVHAELRNGEAVVARCKAIYITVAS